MSTSRYRHVILVLLGVGVYITDVCSAERKICNSVTSFNTGLTPAIEGFEDRLPRVKKAIVKDTSDVMCLQEVWYESSMQSILSSVGNKYPYHYSAIHSGQGSLRPQSFMTSWLRMFMKMPEDKAPCTSQEVSYMTQKVFACAMFYTCWTKGGLMGKVVCVIEKCSNLLKSARLSQDCLSCAFFTLAQPKHLSQCTSTSMRYNRFNMPGLMILSKHPITSTKYVEFFPTNKLLVKRGYLEVEIENIGKVVCTHLSAYFPEYFEFDMPLRNYEQQQRVELFRLSKFKNTDHILVGDLNTGPTLNFPSGKVTGVYPDHFWRLIKDHGYSFPYLLKSGKCTYCSKNPLSMHDDDRILDHVLFKGDSYKAFIAKREIDDDYVSDHYGVKVSFCKIP